MRYLTKQEFINLVNSAVETEDYIESLYDLKIDVMDSPLYENAWNAFTKFMKAMYGEELEDIISWWVCEARHNTEDCMWDKDKTPIPMKTADDLWNYIQSEINESKSCLRRVSRRTLYI